MGWTAALIFAVCVAFGTALLAAEVACGGKTPEAIEASAYQSELLLCVAQADAKVDSQACRAEVRAKYMRMWADAGIEAGDAK